ncbi:CS1 type fimbrial major subunit [Rahnella perminowiae]|uniref:Fimbrial protein n=1 Tax=Rahnella perminowiae TaxID=2816244 RepID=A0ABS6L8X2_9GAMM|nr:CS1 type fimbrial major subunit [Rahnella perminowiae]MBU9823794.1 fimbrial protein [Rahnella perminowiae]MBU9838048.1 fimbrial protein [Rahnella perminowiae]UJD90723.1 Cro/Cl family transcriptional regulator [Rahnella aquatilis]
MKSVIKPLIATMIMGMAINAYAVQKDITVTANVDATLDMTTDTGGILPSTMEMNYKPGIGLESVSQMTKIFSNDAEKDVNINLAGSPQLMDTVGTNPNIPLTVKYGDLTLTQTQQTMTATTLFPNGDTANGSIIQPLKVSQTAQSPVASGNYSGVVSVVLTQATVTP